MLDQGKVTPRGTIAAAMVVPPPVAIASGTKCDSLTGERSGDNSPLSGIGTIEEFALGTAKRISGLTPNARRGPASDS